MDGVRDLITVERKKVFDPVLVPIIHRPGRLPVFANRNDVHRAKMALMDGCAVRMRAILASEKHVVEFRDIVDGDGLPENPLTQVVDKLLFVWTKTNERNVGTNRYDFANVDNLRSAVREDRGTSIGDEIGGKAVDEFQDAIALEEQRVSVMPYHAHVGASCKGFAATTG